MTLIGLVQHMAEVERGWFRRKFAGEQVPALCEVPAGLAGSDGGFEVADGATVADAIAGWQAEIASAKDI